MPLAQELSDMPPRFAAEYLKMEGTYIRERNTASPRVLQKKTALRRRTHVYERVPFVRIRFWHILLLKRALLAKRV